MGSNKEHIPSLDGLRAVSILIVFISHCGLENIVPGGLGVTIFFFISGFLITTLLRLEWTNSGAISLRKFYLRRIFRIWPPFYIVLFAGLALTQMHVIPGHFSWAGVMAQVCHFTNYNIILLESPTVSGTGVYWSLAIEEHFYLLFPMLYILLNKRAIPVRRQTFFLMTICGLILIWRCILVMAFHSTIGRTYYASDTRFDNILFGCILAISANPVLDKPIISDRLLLRIGVPCGIGLLLLTLLVRGDVFRETLRYSLQSIALVPIFIAAVRCPKHLLFRWLNWRWMCFLGVISYSLYLVHQTVIITVKDHSLLHPAIRGWVAFAIAVGIASLLHFVVERPFAKLRKRFR